MKIKYCHSTKTMRVMPQNHMLMEQSKGHWVFDYDSAIPKEITRKAFSGVLENNGSRFWGGDTMEDYLNSLLRLELNKG